MTAEVEWGPVTSFGREWMLQGMVVVIGGGFRAPADGDGLHHLQVFQQTESRKEHKKQVNCIATPCAQWDMSIGVDDD
jgi:glutamate synthase domain-containing protein 3